MSRDRLAKLIEQQRKRQIAALLAVCTPQEREEIMARRRVAATDHREVDGGHMESPIDCGKASFTAARHENTERSLENEQPR